jgi:hypothetical protein
MKDISLVLMVVNDNVTFYMMDSHYFDWVNDNKNLEISDEIFELLENTEFNFFIKTKKKRRNLRKELKYRTTNVPYFKMIMVSYLCDDFYSMRDVLEYCNQNDLNIINEALLIKD